MKRLGITVLCVGLLIGVFFPAASINTSGTGVVIIDGIVYVGSEAAGSFVMDIENIDTKSSWEVSTNSNGYYSQDIGYGLQAGHKIKITPRRFQNAIYYITIMTIKNYDITEGEINYNLMFIKDEYSCLEMALGNIGHNNFEFYTQVNDEQTFTLPAGDSFTITEFFGFMIEDPPMLPNNKPLLDNHDYYSWNKGSVIIDQIKRANEADDVHPLGGETDEEEYAFKGSWTYRYDPDIGIHDKPHATLMHGKDWLYGVPIKVKIHVDHEVEVKVWDTNKMGTLMWHGTNDPGVTTLWIRVPKLE